MDQGPRSGRWAPGSVKALLLLVAVILAVGLLIGAALTAIGPSQDPNTSIGHPAPPPVVTA
jgi:hypothetical protein